MGDDEPELKPFGEGRGAAGCLPRVRRVLDAADDARGHDPMLVPRPWPFHGSHVPSATAERWFSGAPMGIAPHSAALRIGLRFRTRAVVGTFHARQLATIDQ
jgi:hypothetical protein